MSYKGPDSLSYRLRRESVESPYRPSIGPMIATNRSRASQSAMPGLESGLMKPLVNYEFPGDQLGFSALAHCHLIMMISHNRRLCFDLLGQFKKMGLPEYQIGINSRAWLQNGLLTQSCPELLIVEDSALEFCQWETIEQWRTAGVKQIIFLMDGGKIKASKKPQILWLAKKLGVRILFTPVNPFLLFTLVQIPKPEYYNSAIPL